jgi:kynureninase
MDDPLLARRGLFPILSTTNYLISNSLGAVPEAASSRLQSYYTTWAERGVRAWEETWWQMVAELGDLVGPLIGAEPGTVVFQPNVTIAHAVVFSAFDHHQGRPKIVTDAMHFPSILYLLEGRRAEGAEITVVPSDDGVTIDAGRLIEAIDERTAFVAISHVLFKSAFIQDVAAIAARARELGVAMIVDGYQSVGVIEVDVKALGVDAYIGGCLKWLCGGPGAAFLWIDPSHHQRLAPRLTGWMAHAAPFAFAADLERRGDAWRYLHGTPNIPAFYAARPGLEIINDVGIAAIRAKSIRQTTRLIELAEAAGFNCKAPASPTRRGGTVAIDVPQGYEVSRALKARDILCDYRAGAGVRLSPHFYTRDTEIEAAIAAIEETLRQGTWKEFSGKQAVVT